VVVVVVVVAVSEVRRALGSNQIDVLFIDGDHSKNA